MKLGNTNIKHNCSILPNIYVTYSVSNLLCQIFFQYLNNIYELLNELLYKNKEYYKYI